MIIDNQIHIPRTFNYITLLMIYFIYALKQHLNKRFATDVGEKSLTKTEYSVFDRFIYKTIDASLTNLVKFLRKP